MIVDVSALRACDARTVESLTRLQLMARRLGATIELLNADADLVDLIALVGLSEVLPVRDDSAVETDR